jgi:hypothetical protein
VDDTLKIVIGVIAAIWILCAGIDLLIAHFSNEEGYQDETGYHKGPQPK